MKKMKKSSLITTLVLSLIGLVTSAILVFLHHQLLVKGFGEKSFCTLNEWINCDVVNGSSYAEIWGIPLAGLGLIYYLIVFVETLIALFSTNPTSERFAVLSHLTIGSFLFTLFTAFVSFVKLKALCFLCGALYIINISFLFLIPVNFQQIKSFLSSKCYWKHLSISVVVFALGIAVLLWIGPVSINPHQKTADVNTLVKNHFTQPVVPVDPGQHPVWGNPSAKVIIVEFSDFECPFCRTAAQNFKPAIKEFKDEIAFYFVNYPLDNSCNVYVQHAMHKNSCNAAKAAFCASKDNMFWGYHDMLFDNQKNLSSGALLDYAQKLGLNRDKMMSCIFSEEALNVVKQDIELGKTLAVSGTPTFFVNGRRLSQWNNFKLVRGIIREELKKGGL